MLEATRNLVRLCQWRRTVPCRWARSEEHTSELQSQSNLVCRLLLEKKKQHIHRVSHAPTGVSHKRGPLLFPSFHPRTYAPPPTLCDGYLIPPHALFTSTVDQ